MSSANKPSHVVIVGAGFAGLQACRALAGKPVQVSLIDRRNHHLFQPLLYQVAMAGLSPAEIAVPIRTLFSRQRNVKVILGEVTQVDPATQTVSGAFGSLHYDHLIMAAGAQHSYFGNEHWEQYAPGLKSVEQATEIRRRVLLAFEFAERQAVPEQQKRWLSFVIVGGGPTGVELAGAIGEMSRYTLARDFRNVDPKLTRIVLVEAGPRILPMFNETLSARATRELERLGVQVWTNSLVTKIDDAGIEVGEERWFARTVLWAAGVKASPLGSCLNTERDPQGRVKVNEDLSIPGHREVFVLGDQARFTTPGGGILPGIAPVAMQQGRFIARQILRDLAGKERVPFEYADKGQMATIGRRQAIVQVRQLRFAGMFAWLVWLLIHIFYLIGFKNRALVLIQWAYSYFRFARGARLIVSKDWRSYPQAKPSQDEVGPDESAKPLPPNPKPGRLTTDPQPLD